MTARDRVTSTIYRAIDDVNPLLPPSRRLDKTRDTVLFGREEGLDSLELVNLIGALERHLEKDFGRAVSLSISDMMLEPENPFTSVRSLEGYVVSLLQAPISRAR